MSTWVPHGDGWGAWLRTSRQWGSGRRLKGSVHFMVTTGVMPRRLHPRSIGDGSSLRGLCGYVPHEDTQMIPATGDAARCHRCLMRWARDRREAS